MTVMSRVPSEGDVTMLGQQPATQVSADASLAGAMAHEFNNILTTILGYAEMLSEVLPEGSAGQDFAEEIIESGRRAERIAEQVLIISRRGRPMTRPFDVLEAASAMLPALYTSVAQTTRLDIDLSDEPMVMLGTPNELQHMLVNLCRNASEAQNGAGSVVLTIAPAQNGAPSALSHGTLTPGRYLKITVADSGPGIAESEAKRIFAPFVTTRGELGHVGLGLSVVEASVSALQGCIDVRPNIDGGACFSIYFPRL